MICSPSDHDWPDTGAVVPCCDGVAYTGDPRRCTCWVPVYDVDQADPRPAAPGLRSACCEDCAYRGGSPERQDDPAAASDADDLALAVELNRPFFCHQGMRRPLRYVHPTGATYTPEGLEMAYDPPIADGVPYRADGTPQDICAGWAAARLRQPAGGAPA